MYMLGGISATNNIYIVCGYTDMRKSIDGLAAIVQKSFKLNPVKDTLFLRRDRLKVLH